MKLGVFTTIFPDMNIKDAVAYLTKEGIKTVEIGCGGFPGKAHCDPELLLGDGKAFNEFKDTVYGNGLEISALACHGNPVHPDKPQAKIYHDAFINTVLLAEKLGISRITAFSGCPGDSENSNYPNWVTCPWPDDFLKILDYQWQKVLIPYWKETAAFAREHGVTKICIEMHPGFSVYNPETLLCLRDAVGGVIGVNLDPSHLMWQGMEPTEAIKALGAAIYHVHAKDAGLDRANVIKNGILDTKPLNDALNRAWIFRTPGYGSDTKTWKGIISMLKTVGYDDVISFEYEDSLMPAKEGLKKAIAFLNEVMLCQ